MMGSGAALGMGIVYSLRDEFSDTADKIKGKFKELEGVTDSAIEKFNKATNGIKLGFAAMATGAMLLTPLGMAVSKSMEYNAVMSDVAAKSRASAQEMELLREQSLKLGEATKYSAKEVGEGQAFLAMAGFKVNDTLQAMPGMLSLAAAGNIELARSADITSNVLAQFSLKADQSQRAADVFARTITTANVNMEQMSESMKYMGPTAAALGVSLEETSAMIGLLGNAGLQGGGATRALGTALTNLTKPTKQMAEMMQQIGFSAFDTTGNFVGMAGMVANLEKGLHGLTQEQRLSAISTIFGSEAVQEINVLLNAQREIMVDGRKVTLQGAAALQDYTKELNNVKGAADLLARMQLDNLKGDVEELGGVWETTLIRVGDAIEPLLRLVVQGFTKILEFGSAFAGTGLGKAVVFLITGLGLLLTLGGALVVIINAARFGALQAAVSFKALGLTQISAAFASGGLAAGLKAVAVAGWAALAPLLPFIAIGLAVVAVFYGLYKMLTSSNDKLVKFGAIIGMLLGPVTGLFTLLLLAKRSVDEFKKVLEGGELKGGFIGGLQKIGGIIMGVVEIFKTWNGETFTLSEGMHDALERMGLLDFVLSLGTWVVRIKEFLKGMRDAAVGMFDPIREAWGRLKSAFTPVQQAFQKWNLSIGKNTSSIEMWKKAGSVAMKVILAPLKLIVWAVVLIIEGVRLAVKLFDWLSGKSVGIINYFGQLYRGFLDFIYSIPDGISSMVDSIINFFLSIPEYLSGIGGSIVDSIINGIVNAWSGLKEVLLGLLKDLPFGNEILGMVNELTGGGGAGNLQLATAGAGTPSANIGNLMARKEAAKTQLSAPNVNLNVPKQENKQPFIVSLNLDGKQIAQVVNEENEMKDNRN
jgi:TP901 family phage tail tape measure protein